MTSGKLPFEMPGGFVRRDQPCQHIPTVHRRYAILFHVAVAVTHAGELDRMVVVCTRLRLCFPAGRGKAPGRVGVTRVGVAEACVNGDFELRVGLRREDWSWVYRQVQAVRKSVDRNFEPRPSEL